MNTGALFRVSGLKGLISIKRNIKRAKLFQLVGAAAAVALLLYILLFTLGAMMSVINADPPVTHSGRVIVESPFSGTVISHQTFGISYGQQLTKNQYAVYSAIIGSKPSDTRLTVSLPEPIQLTVSPDKLEELLSPLLNSIAQPAIDAAVMDEPLLFWLDIPNTVINTGSLSYDPSQREVCWCINKLYIDIKVSAAYSSDPERYLNSVTDAVARICAEGDTFFERVKSIHDSICQLVTYGVTGSDPYSVYGALVSGVAVCEGYSEAFALACRANGITCISVSGYAGGGAHMWNYVRMDDGKWYAVDCTWDDSGVGISYSYFLCTSSLTASHIPYCDFSDTGIMIFSCPELSENEYRLGGNVTGDTQTETRIPEASDYGITETPEADSSNVTVLEISSDITVLISPSELPTDYPTEFSLPSGETTAPDATTVDDEETEKASPLERVVGKNLLNIILIALGIITSAGAITAIILKNTQNK